MESPAQLALIAGGSLTALASLAHLACIWIGGPAYRFMGAAKPSHGRPRRASGDR